MKLTRNLFNEISIKYEFLDDSVENNKRNLLIKDYEQIIKECKGDKNLIDEMNYLYTESSGCAYDVILLGRYKNEKHRIATFFYLLGYIDNIYNNYNKDCDIKEFTHKSDAFAIKRGIELAISYNMDLDFEQLNHLENHLESFFTDDLSKIGEMSDYKYYKYAREIAFGYRENAINKILSM